MTTQIHNRAPISEQIAWHAHCSISLPMHIPKTLVLSLVLSLLGACGVLAAIAEKPTATVQEVSLSSAGFGGVRGTLGLQVHNPNPFGLPLYRIDWTLSVGRAQAVSGSIQLDETIPAKASLPVTTALSIATLDAARVARELLAGAHTYSLRATLFFKGKYGEIKFELQHDGQLGR